MASAHVGEVQFKLGGSDCVLLFDWRALSALRTELTKEAQAAALAGDVSQLATLVAIGLQAKQPEITAEKVYELSPPIMPTIKAVERALSYAYFGPDEPQIEGGDENPQKPLATPLLRLWQRLTGLDSSRQSSGE